MTTPAPVARPRRGGDRGVVLLLTALVLPVLLIATAFALDLGRQRSARRGAQADADVIALDLARLIDGSTAANAMDPGGVALAAAATRNDVPVSRVSSVQWGTLDAATKEFIACSTCIPAAVQVTVDDAVDYLFRNGSGDVTRSAVAANHAVAGFQIGSKLATVNTQQADLLNGVLGDALDANLALSAATYQGLAGSTINLGDLSSQMGYASPDELAQADVGAREFFLANAAVLEQSGDTAAASVFESIAFQTDEDAVLDMGDFMFIAAGGGRAAAGEASVDAFNVLSGTVYAINGSEAISVPNLSFALPLGIASHHLNMHVVQAPQIAFGPVGTFRDTSQADLGITDTLSTSGIPILGGLLRVTGTITLRQTIAGARGTLNDIECGSNPGIAVGVTPRPVSTVVELDLDVKLGSLTIAEVNQGVSASPIGQSGGGSFDYPDEFLPDVGTGTMVEAPTSPLGLANLLQVTNSHVTVLNLPLGVTLSGVVGGLNSLVLNPVISNLDTLITGPISTALGLSVGAADVGAINMTCNAVQLVG